MGANHAATRRRSSRQFAMGCCGSCRCRRGVGSSRRVSSSQRGMSRCCHVLGRCIRRLEVWLNPPRYRGPKKTLESIKVGEYFQNAYFISRRLLKPDMDMSHFDDVIEYATFLYRDQLAPGATRLIYAGELLSPVKMAHVTDTLTGIYQVIFAHFYWFQIVFGLRYTRRRSFFGKKIAIDPEMDVFAWREHILFRYIPGKNYEYFVTLCFQTRAYIVKHPMCESTLRLLQNPRTCQYFWYSLITRTLKYLFREAGFVDFYR